MLLFFVLDGPRREAATMQEARERTRGSERAHAAAFSIRPGEGEKTFSLSPPSLFFADVVADPLLLRVAIANVSVPRRLCAIPRSCHNSQKKQKRSDNDLSSSLSSPLSEKKKKKIFL